MLANPTALKYFSTSEILRLSARHIQQGKCSQAIEEMCHAYVHELNAWEDDAEVEQAIREFPEFGVRLVDDNGTVQAVFENCEFIAPEATAYLTHIHSTLKIGNRKRTKVHKLLAARLYRFYRLLSKTNSRRMAGRPRQQLTFADNLLFGIQLAIYRQLHQKSLKRKLRNIALTLNITQREAKTIGNRYVRDQHLRYLEDECPSRSPEFIQELEDSFQFEDEASYRRFCEATRKSWILTSIHLGNSQAAFARLSQCYPKGTTVASLFLKEEAHDVFRRRLKKFGQRGLDFRQIDSSRLSAVRMIALLRNNKTVLNMMFDLPSPFGQSTTVDFLGREARFSRGVAELAIIARCPIVPMFTYHDGQKNVIRLEKQIDTCLWPGEVLAGGVRRVTQTLVRHAEEYIQEFTSQWLFAVDTSSYFVAPEVNQTARSFRIQGQHEFTDR